MKNIFLIIVFNAGNGRIDLAAISHKIHVFFAAMYSPVLLGWKYLMYFLGAKNGQGHGIHSPFVFDLVTSVLNDKGYYYPYNEVEGLRQRMLERSDSLPVRDLGAGSRKGNMKERKVSDIARHALKPAKYGQLLFRLANYYQHRHILELGTSLGITTSYLSSASHAARVMTLEGVPAIAETARQNFAELNRINIELIQGNFDDTLPNVLNSISTIDMAYIDGNHRLEPTLRYFKQMLPNLHHKSLVVFDDIHWSKEMEEAWQTVKTNESVTLTIDLFFIGLVFFDPSIKVKQHFTIRF